MYRRALVATVALASSLFISTLTGSAPAQASSNGAAKTPPMGWSSWSFIRKNPTEANIEAQAKAMSTSGLVSHGYSYVNIDDFYYLDPTTNVDQYGRWVIDSSKFPNGMKAVGDYVHGLGEKFGMYLTPGIPVGAYNANTPIQGTSYHARDIVSDTTDVEKNYNFRTSMYFIDYNKNPAAAQAYLNSWADLLASYGVDYIKIDGVGTGDLGDVTGWSTALAQSGRTIHFGLSNGLAFGSAATWKQYANSWRISGDIECLPTETSCTTTTMWSKVASRFTDLPKWAPYASSGGWNDPDSILVGNGDSVGINANERKSQVTLWAISKASMLLGTDLTNLTSADLALLNNDDVISVDQTDAAPATPISQATSQQVWVSPKNSDGSYTVAMFNLGSASATVTANLSDLGFTGTAAVRDLWEQKAAGTATNSFSRTLGSHASALFKVTPNADAVPVGGTLVSTKSGRCADVPNSVTTNGTPIEVYDCGSNKANQRVTYSASSKALKILGKCFDVYENGTAPGTPVDLYDCGGKANQQWNVNSDGTITGVQSGLCLDVTGSTNPNGTPLELWTCSGATNQKWTLGAGVKIA